MSAIGLKAAVGHSAESLSDGARLAPCGGVALYLGGHIAFGLRLVGELSVAKAVARRRVHDHLHRGRRIAAWATVGTLAGVLALLVVSEHRRAPPGTAGVTAGVDIPRATPLSRHPRRPPA